MSKNLNINQEETEELVAIARSLGFDKVASKLLGEDVEEEEEIESYDDCGSKLPSQHSRSAVFDTLKSMGVEWID
jgi:hypothetical protein